MGNIFFYIPCLVKGYGHITMWECKECLRQKKKKDETRQQPQRWKQDCGKSHKRHITFALHLKSATIHTSKLDLPQLQDIAAP